MPLVIVHALAALNVPQLRLITISSQEAFVAHAADVATVGAECKVVELKVVNRKTTMKVITPECKIVHFVHVAALAVH